MNLVSRRVVGVALVAIAICAAFAIQSATGRITGRRIIASEEFTTGGKTGPWGIFGIEQNVGVNRVVVSALALCCAAGVGCIVWPRRSRLK